MFSALLQCLDEVRTLRTVVANCREEVVAQATVVRHTNEAGQQVYARWLGSPKDEHRHQILRASRREMEVQEHKLQGYRCALQGALSRQEEWEAAVSRELADYVRETVNSELAEASEVLAAEFLDNMTEALIERLTRDLRVLLSK